MDQTMKMPKMASLKRTESDKRKDMGEPASIESIAPDYPWGTCLHLDRDEMEKIGIAKLPDVGTEYTIVAKVKVTSVRQSAAESAPGRDPDESMSMDLQITDMGIA